jgi:hypothetical protein
LSERRITKAVPAALRDRFGVREVHVSCSATLREGERLGSCEIDSEPYIYRVRP